MVTPKSSSDSARAPRGTVGFIWYFLSAYPARSALMVMLLTLSGIAEGVGVVSILPVLETAGGNGQPQSTVGQIVTEFVGALGLPPTLGVLLTVIVVAMSLKAVLLWIALRSVGNTTADVTADLRLEVLRSLFHTRWRYYVGKPTGELANTLSTEAQRASSAFRQAAQMLANSSLILVYAVASILISWQATAFAIGAGLLFLLVFNRLVALSKKAGREQTKLMKSLTGQFVDVVSGLKGIKAMALQEQLFSILQKSTLEFSEAQKEQVYATETQRVLREPVVTLFLATGIFSLTAMGEPVSKILVLAFIAYRILGIIGNVQGLLQSVVVGESAFWSLMDLLEELRAEQEEPGGSLAPPTLTEGIRLDGVSFSYEEMEVLSGLDLVIPRGAFVAIVGESGVGKTTVADLIAGLLTPDSGQVLIDDVPLSSVSLAGWRGRIGYVPQDPLLLNDSIRNNLTFGNASYDEEDLLRALSAADAEEFVSELPKGLDTSVGEHGGRLSGGQRQRIVLARALLHRPSLLILDEPTTALDPKTESEVCRTLATLGGDHTIVAVSHQSAIRTVADIVYEVVGKAARRLRVEGRHEATL